MRRTGWRFYRDPAGTSRSMPGYLSAYVDRMENCAARLASVSLECRPALDVLSDYGQHESNLIYCDPPYLASTRGWGSNYAVEMRTDAEHAAFLDAVRGCAAAVVISGYPSQLYDDALAGWSRVEMAAWTGNGIRGGATKAAGNRVEVLWSNRPLDVPASLFDVGASA